MAVTETSSQSWFSRLGNSFKSIVTGLVLFLGAFPLLFWNEGRAVATAKALDEGASKTVSADCAALDKANEGKLVHVTGQAATSDVLTDPLFGVSATAIALSRSVEMYQWRENKEETTEKNLGGSETKKTTYTYDKVWFTSALDSSSYKEPGHENPQQMPFDDKRFYAPSVKLGAFRLTSEQIHQIGNAQSYALPASTGVPASAEGRSLVRMENGFYLSAPRTNVQARALSGVPATPEVGDVRVTYSVVLPHEISVVAVQKGDTFAAYTAANGHLVQLLDDGVHTAQEMFASAKRSNSMLTWILRVVGFLLMFIGLQTIFGPLSVLGDVVPFIGSLLGGATKFAAFLIALPCTLVTIGLAWFVYRPVYGIALLVAAGALIAFLFSRKRAKKPESQVTQ